MKVTSTNSSVKRIVQINGEDVETGMYKTAKADGITLTPNGVIDDAVIDRRYHGGQDKACYLYGENNYPHFQKQYPNLDWEKGIFGENITIDQLNDSELRIGDVYRLGEAVVQISEPRLPCSKFGHRMGDVKAIKYFSDAPYPGAYVRVLIQGKVKPGDSMELMASSNADLKLIDVYRLMLNQDKSEELIQKVVNHPELSDQIKEKYIHE